MSQVRKKRSPIWTISVEKLNELAINSTSMSDVLRALGYRAAGASFKILKLRFSDLGIDVSHFPEKGANLRDFKPERIDLSKALVENSTTDRKTIKRAIRRDSLIPYNCAVCGLGPEWNNQILTLILDHINGVYNDNRLENLRFLCPNCNSQQETFSGRNKRKMVGVG